MSGGGAGAPAAASMARLPCRTASSPWRFMTSTNMLEHGLLTFGEGRWPGGDDGEPIGGERVGEDGVPDDEPAEGVPDEHQGAGERCRHRPDVCGEPCQRVGLDAARGRGSRTGR